MHPKNRTKYKSLNKVAADVRCKLIYSEQNTGDGLWIDLADGYTVDHCTAVHEHTVAALIAQFKRAKVKPSA